MIYRNTNAHVKLPPFVLIGLNWPHTELSPRRYLLPADLGGQLKKNVQTKIKMYVIFLIGQVSGEEKHAHGKIRMGPVKPN